MDEMSLVLIVIGLCSIVLIVGVLSDAGFLFARKGAEREAVVEIIIRYFDQDAVIMGLTPPSMIGSSLTINAMEKTEWGYYWFHHLWIFEGPNIPLIATALAFCILYLVMLRVLCFGLSFLVAKICHTVMD